MNPGKTLLQEMCSDCKFEADSVVVRIHDARTLRVDYTNWYGERRKRLIRPRERGLQYTSTKYHPEPQWLLEATDIEDGKIKWFSLKDIHSIEEVKPGES